MLNFLLSPNRHSSKMDKSGITPTQDLYKMFIFCFIPQLKLATLTMELGLTDTKSWRLTWSHSTVVLVWNKIETWTELKHNMEAFKEQIQQASILKGGLIASQALPETLGLLPTCINHCGSLMDRIYHTWNIASVGGPTFVDTLPNLVVQHRTIALHQALRLPHGPH